MHEKKGVAAGSYGPKQAPKQAMKPMRGIMKKLKKPKKG